MKDIKPIRSHIRTIAAIFIVIMSDIYCAWGGADGPDCTRQLTLAFHEHGLLYSVDTDSGIDKDITDELIRRSGCTIAVTLMPRARIWQLIESGTLDFSLSGIANSQRDKFAAFAWYVKNSYYLLVRSDSGVRSLSDFEHNPDLKLGIIRSFRYSDTANSLVDRLTIDGRVSQSNGLPPLYQALKNNYIQGMIIEPFDYPVLDEKNIRAMSIIFEFNDPPVPHGLIMSKRSLSTAEQEKWASLINSMRADGTIHRIFEKYFPPDLALHMTEFDKIQ